MRHPKEQQIWRHWFFLKIIKNNWPSLNKFMPVFLCGNNKPQFNGKLPSKSSIYVKMMVIDDMGAKGNPKSYTCWYKTVHCCLPMYFHFIFLTLLFCIYLDRFQWYLHHSHTHTKQLLEIKKKKPSSMVIFCNQLARIMLTLICVLKLTWLVQF